MSANRRYVYFSDEEVEGLDSEFVSQLDLARKVAEVPFIITSGFRTPEKNQSLAGSSSASSHLKGLAVDLAVDDDRTLFKIVSGVMSAGINRIGIYIDNDMKPTHVHVDVDKEKIAEIIFIKQEASYVQAA